MSGFAVTASSHNHCTHCDGRATAREMAEAACKAGFSDFGFSCHSDPFCARLDEEAYIRDIRALAREYAGRLRIALGVEQDLYKPVARREAFDYVLGSVHYVKGPRTGRLYAVDADAGRFAACVEEFGGDGLAAARAYYEAVEQNVRRFRPDVVGHLDLIVKNNARGRFFSEDAPAYRAAALRALACCAEAGCIVEINTGGVYRGYRDTFYPAPFLLRALAQMGGKVTVNADAHEPAAVAFGLARAARLAAQCGFRQLYVLKAGRFVPQPLAPCEAQADAGTPQ